MDSHARLRMSRDVLGDLLNAMAATVIDYHPDCVPTPALLDELIDGTAAFPGGSGLWRGCQPHGVLPLHFPDRPLMFVAHNFDSPSGFKCSVKNGGEGKYKFWMRILDILRGAQLSPHRCFVTNALMGTNSAARTGRMPSTPGYTEQCRTFLTSQIEIVRPSHVVALGRKATTELSVATGGKCNFGLLHPSAWHKSSTHFEVEGRRLAQYLAGTQPLF